VTYITSHRHTIRRSKPASFEEFLAAGGTEGRAARERKWQWIQQGFEAPGAETELRVYAGYLRKMNDVLNGRDWLAGDAFSMADIAMTPYLFRLEVLALDAIWRQGRLPKLEDWYARVRARPAFDQAFRKWMPEQLAAEMHANGERARPQIEAILGL
jgi:glutathione S-transferase